MNRLAHLLWPLALAGCASPMTVASQRVPQGPDRAAVTQVVARAAAQVQRCYRSPKLNRMARQIITVLQVSYTPDGNLAQSPMLSRQEGVTDVNRIYAGQMARAAIEAVERCAPLRLPPELYAGGWNEFELTFSPRGLA